jgi:hypothetical protein
VLVLKEQDTGEKTLVGGISKSCDRHTFDELLKTSIDLDKLAMKNLENLLSLGSRRLAQDFREMLDSAVKAVEQNSKLLVMLRDHLNASHDSGEN